MTATPATPPPDTRDWLAVLEVGCEECGWRPHPPDQAVVRLAAAVPRWSAVLGRDAAARRPSAVVWSPLEYACHVRDIIGVWAERAGAMLASDDPVFASFDGDEVALRKAYWAADPAEVRAELARNVAATVEVLDGLTQEEWSRTGRRGDGARFTVATLSLYFSHELTHHLEDANG